MAQLPLDQAIKRLQTNDERLEKFANGGVGESYTSSAGAVVPSIQKFLATKNTEINVGAESALAGAVAAMEAAELSATDAADSAASLIGSGTAALIGTVPAGNLTAVNVQGALDELDYEKVSINQLASTDGASLIGYITDGVGAVDTTVHGRLREIDYIVDGLDSFKYLESTLNGVSSFLENEISDYRGDNLPTYLRRVVEYRRLVGSTEIYEAVAEKSINTTAVAYCLRYYATISKNYPTQAGQTRHHIAVLADALVALQHKDARKARFGGIALAPKDGSASAFGSAYAGLGLLAAYRVTNNPAYLQACRNIATFLSVLNSPNAKYTAIYGVAPIPAVAQNATWNGFCDQISASDTITTTHTTWNLVGCMFLKELYEETGTTAYQTLYVAVRDWGATGLTSFYDFHAVYHAGALPAHVSNNWFAAGITKQDGAWHRRGEDVLSGGLAVNTIGSDQMEYAIEALYATGYTLATIKTAYDTIQSWPNADGGAFGAAYDGRICWPGYFRINAPVYGGESKAYGSHYDTQGIGPLLKFKHDQYPSHYAVSEPKALLAPTIGTLVDKDFATIWSADYSGVFEYTTVGTGTVKGVIAIGLMEALNA